MLLYSDNPVLIGELLKPISSELYIISLCLSNQVGPFLSLRVTVSI